MSEISLKKNVSWMLIGNSVYAFTQWIQLSIIAKLCTPLMLGSYTLALAITAPIFLFLGLQLRALIVTDTQEEWSISSYLTLRVVCMTIAVGIIVCWFLIDETSSEILLLVALLKCIEGFSEIFNAKQQLCEKMRYIAQSLILKGIFATISIFLGVYLFNSLSLGLFFAIISNLIVLFFNDYLNCKHLIGSTESLSVKFDGFNIKKLIVKSIPLGIVMLIISLNTNVSKYIVEYFRGTDEQGVYSTIAYCLVLGNFVNAAMGQSFTPRLSKYFANHDRQKFIALCKKYVTVNIIMALVLFVGSFFVGSFFLKFMFSPRIAEYADLFSLVMFSGIFLYIASALGYTLTSMRVFKVQPYINGAVLIINVLACITFLKIYGIYGVVYASIISYIIQSIITYCVIKKNL